jgi:hypothetical protein
MHAPWIGERFHYTEPRLPPPFPRRAPGHRLGGAVAGMI